MIGERGIQDDTWEEWADDGIISEFKREAESTLAVVYTLQKLKMKTQGSQNSLNMLPSNRH